MRNGSASVRVRVKGVNTVTRRRKDGSTVTYYYHRATGLRLEGAPNTPAFLTSYVNAERRAKDKARGGISQLIRSFEQTPEHAKFRDTTAREYRRKFAVIDRVWGWCEVNDFESRDFRKDVLAWRDGIAAKTPREADNLVSALARLGAYALDRGMIGTNVLDKVKRAYRSDRADKIWLTEHVEAFQRIAPDELTWAMMLALHTGQRQGDLLRLPWSAYDGRRVMLRQSKGGVNVAIPCTVALNAMLDGMERRSPLILTTKTGRAWTAYHFRHKWAEAMKRAGVEGLHFHDLRGTAVTMLAEAGCTPQETAAITGHGLEHVGRILDVYLSRTAALAEAAIIKLDARAKRLQSGS